MTDTKHRETCRGQTVAGKPCESPFVGEDGYCVAHGPEGAARMRRRGQTGGARSRVARKPAVRIVSPEEAPPPPKTIEDALEWASWALWAVTTGKIDGRTGHEVGYILRAFMDGRKAADRADERVKALEVKLKTLRQAAGGPV